MEVDSTPMSYFCQQCGECCSVMGQVFSIIENLGEFRYRFRNEYTGDTIEVEIAPHMRELFLSSAVPAGSLNPCPFLRWNAVNEVAFCTVHLTRPDICREYQCWRILVQDEQGTRIARVMEERYVCLEDENLLELWEKFRERLDFLEREEWDDEVIRFFRGLGYTVRV